MVGITQQVGSTPPLTPRQPPPPPPRWVAESGGVAPICRTIADGCQAPQARKTEWFGRSAAVAAHMQVRIPCPFLVALAAPPGRYGPLTRFRPPGRRRRHLHGHRRHRSRHRRHKLVTPHFRRPTQQIKTYRSKLPAAPQRGAANRSRITQRTAVAVRTSRNVAIGQRVRVEPETQNLGIFNQIKMFFSRQKQPSATTGRLAHGQRRQRLRV